jgi:hypothetical protein
MRYKAKGLWVRVSNLHVYCTKLRVSDLISGDLENCRIINVRYGLSLCHLWTLAGISALSFISNAENLRHRAGSQ